MSSFPESYPDQPREVCPYSDPPFGEFTDDHIFPEFLGGRRWVRVCRNCNSRFGHSFEATAATQLRRLQVFVSHFGLDVTRTPATWPSALEMDGTTYNLKSGPSGVQYELARPVILRNEAGDVIGGRARSRSEAEQAAASLIRKGNAKEVKIEEAPGENLNDIKLVVDLSYNADLYRFSAKLVANMTVFMGRRTFVKESGIAGYLHGNLAWNAGIACCDTSAIRNLRPGLSHTVYVEFGPQSHAVVILFGGMQIYVPLPAAPSGAILGFLDPITGEESFGEVKALNITPSPKFWTEAQARACLADISQRFSQEANARGAKHPPTLSVPSFDLGAPSVEYVFVPVWKPKTKS
jgi:HNH endonuclease